MSLEGFRLTRLARAAEHHQADAIVASLPANIAYLTNGYVSVPQNMLASSQAYVLYSPSSGKVVYVISCAEIPSVIEHAGSNASICCFGNFRFGIGNGVLSHQVDELCRTSLPSAEEALARAVDGLDLQDSRIALDEGRVSPSFWEKLSLSIHGNNRLITASSLFSEARIVKHPDEIRGLEDAAVLAEQSLMTALKSFKVGMTECDLERLYGLAMVERGGCPRFFVGTANLRAAYSDTININQSIETNSHIRFDFGGTYNGYYSDLARTASVGKPDDKLCRYYNAVRRGMEQAVAAIRPGVSAREIFEVAVSTTRLNGISAYSRHHCGHGIGVEMYDLPSIDQKTDMLLEKDMVLCIETPYYEIDWGGVQLESTVAVTDNGVRYLDKGSRDLIMLE